MELQQLRYVEAVARHRHFTRAAEELHVAQSALSHGIRRLERELGTELFQRTSRRVQTTTAGEVVAARARRILAETTDLEAELGEVRGLVRGRLGIGAMRPTGELDVAQVLSTFSQEHPGVELQLYEGSAQELVGRMGREEIELGFTLTSTLDGFESLRLGEEELVVAASPSDPLCRRTEEPIEIAELDGRRLVAFRTGSAVRAATDALFARAQITTEIALESNDMLLLHSLVARGFGIALLPRSLAEHPGLELAIRPIEGRPALPVRVFWREDRTLSPLGTRFVEFVRRQAGDVAEATG